MDNHEFGKYFYQLRVKAGFDTQASLARESKVECSTISRIESGDTKTPSFDVLAKLAPVLKVTKEELLEAAGLITIHTEHTPELQELISIFNTLKPNGREMLLSTARNIKQYESTLAAASDLKKA